MGRFGAKISALFKSPAFTAASDVVPPASSQDDNEEGLTTSSFSSCGTDFDNLTCPGAQAEMDDDYMRAVHGHTTRDEDVVNSASVFMTQQDEDCCLRSRAFSSGASTSDGADTDYDSSYSQASPYTSAQASPHRGAQASPYTQVGFPEDMVHFSPMLVVYNGQMNRIPCMELPQQMMPIVEGFAAPSQTRWGLTTVACETHDQVVVDGSGTEASNVESDASRSDAITDARTTLILRNLPNDYTRDMLLELLDSAGCQATYDFAYLPVDIKRMTGLGYAFVNMIDHDLAIDAMQRLHGFTSWKKKNSLKVLEIDWCKPMQGLSQHTERYRNSPLMHPDVPAVAKPILFIDGKQVDFPPPTRQIHPPRTKNRTVKADSALHMLSGEVC